MGKWGGGHMRMLGNFVAALWRETWTTAAFLLGLFSTAVTLLPGVGQWHAWPLALRKMGISIMATSFVIANFRVFVANHQRAKALREENELLRASLSNIQSGPQVKQQKVDQLRALLIEIWKEKRVAGALAIPVEEVLGRLDWEKKQLDEIAFNAAGDSGLLEIGFDGRVFTINRIPK
jgi:hypothetical protein